jgi:hypothetical protein
MVIRLQVIYTANTVFCGAATLLQVKLKKVIQLHTHHYYVSNCSDTQEDLVTSYIAFR